MNAPRRTPNAIAVAAALAASVVAIGAAHRTAAQDTDAVGRGQYLYEDGYKCFACHGYDGQSGLRRLVPLNYTLPGFTALVRNSPFAQMPSYNDVPDDDLAAIFSYIGSLAADAPAIEDVDLLDDIRRRKRAEFD